MVGERKYDWDIDLIVAYLMECAITLYARLSYVLPFMRAPDGRKNEKGGKGGGFVSLDSTNS